MNCNFTEKVSPLIDGELAATEAHEVEHHLLSCSECQQLRADFLNLRSRIVNFETSLPPEVQNPALKKILARKRAVPARGLRWSFATQAVAFASLLIVAAIIGLLVYSGNRKPDSKQAAVVQAPSPVPAASAEPSAEPSA